MDALNPKFTMAANPYYVKKYCKTDESRQRSGQAPD